MHFCPGEVDDDKKPSVSPFSVVIDGVKVGMELGGPEEEGGGCTHVVAMLGLRREWWVVRLSDSHARSRNC